MVRLYAPLSYQLATEEQKSGICNGCGTKKKFLGLFGFNVPDKFWGLSVTEACNIHDWMYDEGGSEEDRLFADEWFLANMKLLINEGRWNFLRRWRTKDAMGYYRGVRIVGKYCFNYRENGMKTTEYCPLCDGYVELVEGLKNNFCPQCDYTDDDTILPLVYKKT